jgi:catechol 2,3-dioxygenase-like lactoylglutathione lyase family enzyme
MLDHIGLTVSDFARAQAFYDLALAPLGIALVVNVTAEQTGGDAMPGTDPTAGPTSGSATASR